MTQRKNEFSVLRTSIVLIRLDSSVCPFKINACTHKFLQSLRFLFIIIIIFV